jgi:hypothetical protein
MIQDALLSSTNANINTGTHGHLNGFVTGQRQARAKQYAQSVALSLLKLIPNEQPDEQQNAARRRRSSRSRQPDRNNVVEPSGDNAAGTYQHTIFNPGAVSLKQIFLNT